MRISLTVVFLAILGGCAATNPLPARLYDLTNGSIVDIKLTNFRDGHGAASARLENGESLTGDYTLSQFYGGDMRNAPKGEPVLHWAVTGAALPGKDDPSWQEVFGYGKESKADPVGTGTLVGDKGTVLSLVFFFADVWEETGSGVARSSTGHWYRFHVGVNSEPGK